VAEWVAAVGTVGTLVGTLAVIRRDHERQADSERRDEALLVNGSVIPVMSVRSLDAAGRPTSAISATVTNDGRRPIEAVRMTVSGPNDESIADESLGTVPARAMKSFEIPSRDGLWAQTGLNVTWRIEFRDAGDWVWRLSSDRQLIPTKPTAAWLRLPFRR